MNWETIVCFGDSITIGARTYLGYPEYIGDLLQKQVGNSWNVLNIAESGFTATDLLRKITQEGNNISDYNPVFFTLLIGTNDVKKSTSLNNFRIAYDLTVLKILLSVKHKNGLLIAIPKLGKGVKYPYKYDMNVKILEYNKIIREIGEKYNLTVLELDLKEEDYFDGVHLNENGGIRVSIQIGNYIMAQKGLETI